MKHPMRAVAGAALFGIAALVLVTGRAEAGKKGRLGPEYTATLSGADASSRKVVLTLGKDGSATLRTEFVGKGTPIVETGKWTQSGEEVTLQLEGKAGQDKPKPLVWKIGKRRLKPVTWDRSLYGAEGLPLKREKRGGGKAQALEADED